MGNKAGEQVVVKVDDIEVSAQCELRGDLAGEMVGGEVEDGEVDEVLEVGGDGAGEEVGGEVKGLEVGAVGEEGGERAAEQEIGEGELVDAPIVAGGALQVGSESGAWVGEGGLGPVLEQGRVLQGLAQVGQAQLVARI